MLSLCLAAALLMQGPPGRFGAPPMISQPRQPLRPGEGGTIEGQVLDQATGAPLRKAALLLRRIEGRPGMGEPPNVATADEAGRFLIKEVPPGRYRLVGERNGYVRQDYGARSAGRPGTVLTVEAGQRVGPLQLKLTPHSVIAGRVVDEDGDPIPGAQVQALRWAYVDGRRQLNHVGSAQTNDLGEYRVYGLSAGKFVLSTTIFSMNAMTVVEKPNQGDQAYTPTFFPGVVDPAAAATFEVPAGTQLRGMDFTLRRVPTVRVRGRVTVQGGALDRPVMVQAFPRGLAFVGGMRRMARTDMNGVFELKGLAPGSYTVTAEAFEDRRRSSGRVQLDLGAGGAEGIQIALGPGLEVQGEVRVEGQEALPGGGLYVGLRPRNAGVFPGDRGGAVKADRTFIVHDVAPEEYRVNVTGVPKNFYLKSALMGDQDILAAGIDLTRSAPGRLVVTLASNGAQVEGDTAPGTTVVIWPDSRSQTQMHLYKTAAADQNGRFIITGIAPGEYRLAAFEDVGMGAAQDGEYLKQFERSAQTLSAKENGKETKTLKAIPYEESARQ